MYDVALVLLELLIELEYIVVMDVDFEEVFVELCEVD
jgi:hypothetical protein